MKLIMLQMVYQLLLYVTVTGRIIIPITFGPFFCTSNSCNSVVEQPTMLQIGL